MRVFFLEVVLGTTAVKGISNGTSCLWVPCLIYSPMRGSILPYSDKRKQVTILPNLRKWCFRLDLAYSTSIPSLEQKHSSYSKISKSRYNDIALMPMHMTDTFCLFTRNVIFKSCFLLSEYGSITVSELKAW